MRCSHPHQLCSSTAALHGSVSWGSTPRGETVTIYLNGFTGGEDIHDRRATGSKRKSGCLWEILNHRDNPIKLMLNWKKIQTRVLLGFFLRLKIYITEKPQDRNNLSIVH